MADERAAQAAYRAEHNRRSDLRASASQVELARAQLADFQRSTALRSAALQRQLEEAEKNCWRAKRHVPEDAGERAAFLPPNKRCPVCGLQGTTGRGRECSNRSGHPAVLARKAEYAKKR